MNQPSKDYNLPEVATTKTATINKSNSKSENETTTKCPGVVRSQANRTRENANGFRTTFLRFVEIRTSRLPHDKKKRESETQTSSKKIKSNTKKLARITTTQKKHEKERKVTYSPLPCTFCIAGIYLIAKQSVSC